MRKLHLATPWLSNLIFFFPLTIRSPEEELSSSSSEEEESDQRQNEDLFGKVVCVEGVSAGDKKKGSWYPALVSSRWQTGGAAAAPPLTTLCRHTCSLCNSPPPRRPGYVTDFTLSLFIVTTASLQSRTSTFDSGGNSLRLF